MATLSSITGFALLIVETLVGTVANGSIVLISCLDWVRSRKLSPTDLLLMCIGSSRLLWQATVMLHVTMFSFLPHAYILNQAYILLRFMRLFSDTINLCFAACLGVWYLTKIAIFSHPVFLQVKQRFPELLPWLLLGSVAFSALKAIIVLAGFLSGSNNCDPYKSLLNNSSESEVKYPRSCMKLATLVIVPNVIPSVIFLLSIVLLIISLRKHTRHLKCNGIGVRDLNSNVHLSAIRALASFAVLYLFSFVALNLQVILAWTSNYHSWTSVFFYNVSGLYPSGHAVILILINPKLKQAWFRMIHPLKRPVSKAPS